MLTKPDAFGQMDNPETLRALLREAVAVLDQTLLALDDASGVVDCGEDEEYPYQRELESAQAFLAKVKEQA